jgi:two-component sensor histidine kinase
MHELAANAARHGALSAVAGTVTITGTERAGEVVLNWREAGGPAVSPSAGSPGFGRRLIMQSVAANLDGRMAYEWPTTGAVVTLHMGSARLATRLATFPKVQRCWQVASPASPAWKTLP